MPSPPPNPNAPILPAPGKLGETVRELHVSASLTGPLPHPNILKLYEEVCPGCAERIIAMAEQEGDHRRDMEERMVDANIGAMQSTFKEGRLGQLFAFGISLAFLLVGAFVAIRGQPWVGGILGSMGLGSVVTSFIRGRQKPGDDGAPSKPQPSPKGEKR